MRILFAGNYQFSWYEEACAEAIEELGHEVIRFSWKGHFESLIGRAEEHLAVDGPVTNFSNRALAQSVIDAAPDMLFVWRGVHVGAPVLREIRTRHPRCVLASYNNDDPFGPRYFVPTAPINQRRLWRRFRGAIPEYDVNFVYRPVNVLEYHAAGACNVHVLIPYFVPKLHRPRALSGDELLRYGCDVVFIGHYEADGREQYLAAIVDAGLKLKIFGNDWPRDVLAKISPTLPPVQPVLGDEYVKALCGAKVCLSFLSKLNRDTYTRRNFEIPACGGVMLSERTSDLTTIFAEGDEAMYFGNAAELVETATALVKDDARRELIASAGMRRVWAGGHDVVSRMRQMLAYSSTNGEISSRGVS